MAADLKIIVTLKDKASKALDRIKGKAGAVGAAAGKVLRAGVLAGAAGLGILGVAAIKMGMDFEKGMAEVRTLIPELGDKGFKKLQDDVLNFSKEIGIATDKVIPALYQAISAGVPRENVMEFMEIASKAAIGGVTELETAVDGLTSVVNAYGAENISAQKAADIMFTGVKLGKTTFDELSQSLFNVIPIAAASGVSFEEVTAGLAAMTAQGVPTNVATTQLRAAIQALSAPTVRQEKLMKELGLEFSAARLQEIGLSAAMKEAMDATGGNMGQLRKLIGSVEGVQAVLALSGEQSYKFTDALAAMETSTGAVDTAFETMEQTASRKLQKAINLLKVELTKLGVRALPLVAKALERAVPWLEKNLPLGIKKIERFIKAARPHVEKFIKLFGTGLRTLKQAFEPLVRFILNNKPALIAAIAAIGVAILLAFGPGAIAIAAIIGLIVVLGLLRENWDKIKEAISGAIDDIIAKIEGIPIIGQIFKATVRVVQDKIKAMISFIQNLIDFVQELVDFVKAIFRGDWAAAWDSMKEMAKIALNLFLDFLQLTFYGTLKSIFSSLNLWDWAKGAFETFKTEAEDFLSGVVDTIFGVGEDIAKALGNGLRAAKGFVTGALNAIITAIQRGANYLISGINKLASPLRTLGGAVNAVLGFFGAPSIPTIPYIPPIEIPRLHKGGEVLETGMAVVHKGERYSMGGAGITINGPLFVHHGTLMGNEAEAERFAAMIDARLRRKWRRQYA